MDYPAIESIRHVGNLTTLIECMGKNLGITASDGHVLAAYLAAPKGKPRGGLVVIQETFGVNAYVRSLCDAYAQDGYASIAPALYDRQRRDAAFDDSTGPEVLAEARRLRAALEWPKVMLDVQAAIDEVRSAGRVGIVGYCVGGSVAWLAAVSLPVEAAACYYGRDIVDFLDRAPRCPTILHFGERDHFIPLADVDRIRAAFPDVPSHTYPAGHGFDGAGARHHEASARLARERTLELLRRHVG
jgi:carboxymethylenebutenolidase